MSALAVLSILGLGLGGASYLILTGIGCFIAPDAGFLGFALSCPIP